MERETFQDSQHKIELDTVRKLVWTWFPNVFEGLALEFGTITQEQDH